MKNEEPQIFTRTDDQNVPVDDAILGALEQEELTESLVREYIRVMLVESPSGPLAEVPISEMGGLDDFRLWL